MITLEKTSEGVKTFFFLVITRRLGENWTSRPRKTISGEATHCLVSALDGIRIQFGIGILTKRICYYPLLLVNRYFLTNDYYSPISKLKKLGTEIVGAGVFSVLSGSKVICLLEAK